MITQDTGWHVHHIQRRVDGGTDQLSNLIMLHPHCHHQLHVGGMSLAYKSDLLNDWYALQS
ncbi:MAG: HNH endonuclease [Candidatus Thiodiazotropha lotti]|nr:HNH endonuclease [Candidatus Thiodiazotropha lotti]